MTQEELTNYAYQVSNRFDKINTVYIEELSKQIKEIGELTPSQLDKVVQLSKMSENLDKINQMLAIASSVTVKELYEVYKKVGGFAYDRYQQAYKMKTGLAKGNRTWLTSYIDAVGDLTNGTFQNLSRTTVISQTYRDTIDTACDAVLAGVDDYNGAVRKSVAQVATNGISVQYSSGVTRRIDSAVRMNVLEGVKQVNEHVRERAGREFGADGVEVSVHALCAPDHLDIQGKQFSKAEFEKVNGALKRKIATCNCHHITFPIILGISEPAYTKEELAKYRKNSTEMLDVNGSKMTRYQATQLQRRMETEMRKTKDLCIAGRTSGDSRLQERAERRLKKLRDTYTKVSSDAGLKPKWDRTYVPGYYGKQFTPKQVTI
nr:MAG TPA: minor capsid protein [Caudoviricetes sp.]